MDSDFKFQSGFGNHFSTEALQGALPEGQNTPQRAPFGLYAEQISGTAFTAPRHENLRSWCYRIRPSVTHGAFSPEGAGDIRSRPFEETPPSPNQLRWDPWPIPTTPTDFLQGLVTVMGNGSAASVRGCGVHVYAANRSMENRFFSNSDGEMLFVPQQGRVHVRTELGVLDLRPGHIGVVPRGIKFQVVAPQGPVRGYLCENYGPPFRLPGLGPIGSNGLANPRDFLSPVAAYEDKKGAFDLVVKLHGALWTSRLEYSPLDVVAWHGNYAPYQYDLNNFQVYSPTRYDHPDPSIFTVLTSPSELAGTANVDFVIFPPRWMVTEKTFRPPYYHRNVMSEFMGLVTGVYDAKQTGFVPGGMSLHNAFAAHGPDADTFEKASQGDQKPEFIGQTMAFMFESSLPFVPTAAAMKSAALQKDYLGCWRGLKSHFDPSHPGGSHAK